MSHRFAFLLLTLGCHVLGPVAMAEDGADERSGRSHRRFSNGPRRVPTPRGASLERAESLGLGTGAARRLLRSNLDPRWVDAAPGDPEDLAWPVADGWFGRGFGFVRQTRPELRHNGVDIGAPEWAVVSAAADGIVAYSDNTIRGFGNCVILVHSNGWVTIYAHLARATVQAGWRASRGERIGFVGQTGIARGPHLHFEVRQNGRVLDPREVFGAEVPRRRDFEEIADPEELGDAPIDPVFAGEPAWDDAGGAAATGDAPTATGDAPTTLAGHRIGSESLARWVRRNSLDAPELPDLRVFSNVLWPVRGGVRTSDGSFRANPGSAIRAGADGWVVFAGTLDGSDVIILAHATGLVSELRGVTDIAVSAGDRVLRGNWLAKSGAAPVELRLYDGGRRQDPAPLLVGGP